MMEKVMDIRRTAVVAIQHDEPNLEEWCRYHEKIADHVFVFCDRCQPPSSLALSKTTFIPFEVDPGLPSQFIAYGGWLRMMAGHAFSHALFIDLDEYVMLHGKTLSDIARPGVVGLNWVFFGSKEEPEHAGDTTTLAKRFCWRAERCNKHVKPLVSLDLLQRFSLSFVNPHCVCGQAQGQPPMILPSCSVCGKIFQGPWCEDGCPDPATMPFIAHYYSKTKEEFAQKIARGRPDCSKSSPHQYFRDTAHMWEERKACDLCEVYDKEVADACKS